MRLNPIPQNPDTIVTGQPQSGFAMNEGDGAYADGPGLPHVNKVVLVMDLVESVRLMALDESGVVARWTGFVRKAEKLIPRYNGRVVKSLGDGLLADFDTAREAALAAAALHKIIQPANRGRNPDQHLFLRIGINAAKVYTGQDDIYGAGVNLAARLATLAGPGETMVSASVRDQLTDGLDVDVEDMGECYLKHIETPVRAYRIGPPGPRPVLVPQSDYAAQLQPTIAVIPFTSRSNAPEHFAIGELIADGVIGQLSRNNQLCLISRLSSTAFRSGTVDLPSVSLHLNANYVLTGQYSIRSERCQGAAELTVVRTGEIIWAQSFTCKSADILDIDSALIGELTAAVQLRILAVETERATLLPLPSLESATVLLGAIALMHRISDQSFKQSKVMLDHLVARHPTHCTPRVWLARWHNLNVTQSRSINPQLDTAIALQLVDSVLGQDPSNALALSIKALVMGFIRKDFDTAAELYEDAVAANPNEGLAWIGRAMLSTWLGQGDDAAAYADKALALSPLDPLRYYYESLAATAYVGQGAYQQAIASAKSSLRRNRTISNTYKALVEAQYLSGDVSGARSSASWLLRLEPDFTVEKFRKLSPLFRSPNGSLFADALAGSGVPLF